MGFWGWPLPQPDQIDRAARAALAIRRAFAAFAADPRHLLAGMTCGIGVAHGPAVAGRLGAVEQAKIGVFGPVANRASRLEGATKRLRVPVLVDEAVAAHLARPGAPDGCRVRRVARVTPQGIPAPILVAELLPPESEPGPNLSEADRLTYEAALDRFLAGDWHGFRQATAGLAADGPTRFVGAFVERTPGGRAPAGWDGGIPVAKPE
jgi:adenylate cyclase